MEAEALNRTSSGATSAVASDANTSGGQWVSLGSNGIGDYVQFTTASIPAGAYDLKLAYKGYNSRGTLQVTVDGIAVGDEHQYSAASTYPTATIGPVAFPHDRHAHRATSSDYTLSADLLAFVPR